MDELVYNITKSGINGVKRFSEHRRDNRARALAGTSPDAVASGLLFYNPAPGAVQNITREEHSKIVANLLRYRGAVGPGAPPNPHAAGTPDHVRWVAAHTSPFAAGTNADTQWGAARNAYAALPPDQQDLADRYMILLDGLTPTQRLTSSDAYHNLNRFDKDRVRRLLPGTGAFDSMRESVRRMARKKNDLEEGTYQYLIKPILPTSAVRTFLPELYSQYMTKFDPTKRYSYMPRLSPIETIRAGRWPTTQVAANFQKQMEKITTLPLQGAQDDYKSIREWNIGVKGTEDNPANQLLVGQIMLSQIVIWDNLTTQSMRIRHDMYRMFKQNIADLRKIKKYGGDNSFYLNLCKERTNKWTIPTPLASQPLSYYELLALGQS